MKVSFNFSKVVKKPNLLQNKPPVEETKKVDLIKCFDGRAIQLVEEKPVEAALVIPVKDGQSRSAEYMKKKYSKKVDESESENAPKPIDPNETIEQRAARELLEQCQKNRNTEDDVNDSSLVLPVQAVEKALDGGVESNLDDYDNIPIAQFGMAMLRGMGWKDDGKKKENVDEPMLRPKGMGLGADKAVKAKPLLVAPEANEKLELKKAAFVKILGGKHRDLYGQIEGLDEYANRVIVKMALGGTKETFNEFLVQPVSKKEYAQYSKVINSAKYDEYKKKEELKNMKSEDSKSDHKYKSESDFKEGGYKKREDCERKEVKKERNRSRSISPAADNRRKDYRSDEKKEIKRSPDSRIKYRRSESEERRDIKKERYRSRTRSPSPDDRRTTHRSDNRSRRYRSESSDDDSKTRKHKKSSKKESHRERSRRHSSSEDERKHKKSSKSKKHKRERSRSRDRRHR